MRLGPGTPLVRWFCFGITFVAAIASPTTLKAQGGSIPYAVHFAHYAVGMGYATTFTLVNTGDTPASGVLALRDPEGNLRTLLQVSMGPGGVNRVRLQGASMRTGWATYEGTGGNVSGVATFEFAERGGILKTVAGVLASSPTSSATIPVEYDPVMELATAYAVANPGTDVVRIRMELLSDDGVLLDNPVEFALLPGCQIARYVHEDFPSLESFHGSVVLSDPAGGRFVVIALAQNSGLLSVLPALPGVPGAN